VIAVENLTKVYGKRIALDHVSFAVPAGEIFGFVGPNGAGDTTTLRILAALPRADHRQRLHRWRRRHQGAGPRAQPSRLHA